MDLTNLRYAAYFIIGLLIGVVFHEYMHGRAADFFGDHTARNSGRLTLNPIKHIDLFGSILLPLVLLLIRAPVFGYAKPVPVNPYFMKHRRDMVFVALVGPATNFTLAGVFIAVGFILKAFGVHGTQFNILLFSIVQINLVLGIFNLIPIPPLDGSHVVEYFLSNEARLQYEKIAGFGFVFVFLFIYLVGGRFFALLMPLFNWAARAVGYF